MKNVFALICLLSLSAFVYAEVETDRVKRIYLKNDLDNIFDSLTVDLDEEKQCLLLARYESTLYKLYMKDDLDLAQGLSWLSTYNYHVGNYTEAIRLCTEVLNIEKEIFGTSHPNYVSSLSNLAAYNAYIGNYFGAIRLGTKALNIYKKIFGTSHPDYATLLSNLAEYNSAISNYTEAIRIGTEALNIYEEIFGTSHPDYARLLDNLAGYNFQIGNYAEAIRLGTEVLNIDKKIFGTSHPDYATSLNNLALYNSDIGNYAEAIRLGTEALNIRKEIFGTSHPDYATSLNNLALCNSAIGNYSEAIRLGTEALNIDKKIFGISHPDYATSLNNLASYCFKIGNYSEAIRLGTEALNIYKEIFGTSHPDYATSLNNLALCNSAIGNYSEAIRLGTEALNIRKEIFGTSHPDYATSLNNLASYCFKIGNYAEAIRLGTEALNIVKEIFGTSHSDYAASLNNLASYNSAISNYTEAIRLCAEALNINKKIFGISHPYYAASLNNLALYNFEIGNYYEGNKYLIETVELKSQIIKTGFSGLISSERQSMWDAEKRLFTEILPDLCYTWSELNLTEYAYNGVLLSKGIILNADIEFASLIAESGDEEVMSLYAKLQTNRKFLSKLYEKPIAERLVDTDSLENECESLERELIQKSKCYGDFTRNMNIDWKQVQSKLNDDEIAIEFVSFPTENDNIMYCALTLKKGNELPRMIPLFEAKQLSVIEPEDYYVTPKISNLVWKPLAEELSDVKDIYFAPAGELYNIAIESLKDFDGDGYIFDNWNFYRLSSTRELALIKEDKNDTNVALYGGIKYDADDFAFEQNPIENYNNYYATTRSLSDSIGLRAGKRYLQHTLIEVEHIASLYSHKSIPTQLYTGLVGSETSIKRLSGKNLSNLHISTHGFYWSESEVKNKHDLKYLRFIHQEDRPRYVEDKAMTRSGLIFAGANAVLQGEEIPEGCDDGILTAQEIAALDFRGLDLLVLSACQTGLGEIKGDGVFGLQRGFKKAGVQSIVMSLWEVPDEATQILMTEFYENYLSGKSKRESLLNAQKVVRESRGFEHPENWAGFILLDGLN